MTTGERPAVNPLQNQGLRRHSVHQSASRADPYRYAPGTDLDLCQRAPKSRAYCFIYFQTQTCQIKAKPTHLRMPPPPNQ